MVQTTRSDRIDVLDHMKWARSIARGTADDYRVPRHSHGELDLEQDAYLELILAARRYDPASCPTDDYSGHFRGFARRGIKTACVRGCERLLGGGTFHTRRRELRMQAVGSLPDYRLDDGTVVRNGSHLADDGRRPATLEPPEQVVTDEQLRQDAAALASPALLYAHWLSLDRCAVSPDVRFLLARLLRPLLRPRRVARRPLLTLRARLDRARLVRDLRSQGFTFTEIASRIGVAPATAFKDLNSSSPVRVSQ